MNHSNGNPLVRVFGPTAIEGRGGAVTVNFYTKEGQIIELLEKQGFYCDLYMSQFKKQEEMEMVA